MREDDRDRQRLNDTDAEQRTSPAVKTFAYAVMAILLLAIILMATGVIKFGPY
jgi:hypothetical protein